MDLGPSLGLDGVGQSLGLILGVEGDGAQQENPGDYPVLGYGFSFDLFVVVGGGLDLGYYRDFQTEDWGVFGDVHVGFGWDQGFGFTTQFTMDPANFGGPFWEVEASPSGLLEVNQTNTGVSSINYNFGDPLPSFHVSYGVGGFLSSSDSIYEATAPAEVNSFFGP